jgi:hypothetical protein
MITYEPADASRWVRFDGVTHSKGRNGVLTTKGYYWSPGRFSKETDVLAITSRDDISYALRLTVPDSAWVGDALEAALNTLHKTRQLPILLGVHPLLDAMIERKLK